MKRLAAVAALVVILFIVAAAQAQEPTARQIMERQRRLHETDSETATVVMLLVDRAGDKKKREVRTWTKKMADQTTRSLMVFLAPEDLAGTALLTWEQDNGEGRQWLYLPASGKLQRVAASSKTDCFMGTDFTYEDMEPDDLDQFDFNLTGSETLDGQDCWVIEAVPATEAKRLESGYGRRVFYVRKDITLTVKIEYFDPRGRPLKVQTAHDVQNVRGDMWMAKKSLMDNQRAKHQTLMGMVSRQVDAAIDDEVFTERYLTDRRHMQ